MAATVPHEGGGFWSSISDVLFSSVLTDPRFTFEVPDEDTWIPSDQTIHWGKRPNYIYPTLKIEKKSDIPAIPRGTKLCARLWFCEWSWDEVDRSQLSPEQQEEHANNLKKRLDPTQHSCIDDEKVMVPFEKGAASFRHLRISKAIKLKKADTFSITALGFEVGYHNPFNKTSFISLDIFLSRPVRVHIVAHKGSVKLMQKHGLLPMPHHPNSAVVHHPVPVPTHAQLVSIENAAHAHQQMLAASHNAPHIGHGGVLHAPGAHPVLASHHVEVPSRERGDAKSAIQLLPPPSVSSAASPSTPAPHPINLPALQSSGLHQTQNAVLHQQQSSVLGPSTANITQQNAVHGGNFVVQPQLYGIGSFGPNPAPSPPPSNLGLLHPNSSHGHANLNLGHPNSSPMFGRSNSSQDLQMLFSQQSFDNLFDPVNHDIVPSMKRKLETSNGHSVTEVLEAHKRMKTAQLLEIVGELSAVQQGLDSLKRKISEFVSNPATASPKSFTKVITRADRNINPFLFTFYAFRTHNLELGLSLMKTYAFDINGKNNNGYTLLHVSARHGFVDGVRWCLGHGAYVNSQNDNKATPLHLAYLRSDKTITKLLKEGNADTEIVDCKGLKPRDYKNNRKPLIRNIPIAACSVEIVIEGLNKPFYLEIWSAARFGWLEVVKLYIEHLCCDIDIKSTNGQTPLMCAVEHRREEVVRYLLQNGADVNARDVYDFTALHYAYGNNAIKIADLLENQFGADSDLKDIFGRTAAWYSSSNTCLPQNVSGAMTAPSYPISTAITIGN
eukprot:TRINITY_DN139_c0_g1_i1.p1 TRINITY_DN139_c0_g1~~TRINITY_DN139_c0_g1_i1.p1  ORF type:complete len:782 (-),score=213.56 TRINITY_DN139_c0_g1_i1:67-2412(-)